MDGIHDLGGKHGHGTVVDADYDAQELPFPERWQASVFSMTRALYAHGVTFNTDQFRHAIERIEPSNYLTDGYYGRWIGGIETLLVEAGVLTQDEITAQQENLGLPQTRVAARPSANPDRFKHEEPLRSDAYRGSDTPPLFAVGDLVVCQSGAKLGHTRLPAYARGVQGVISTIHGKWVYPDSNAHGQGESPEHLYTVRFSGAELWGATAEEDVDVFIDLFEPYLEKVNE
ncbi:MAG: nitrile hydratase subunit beta [Pseudomonadota bacterium]